ncbi:MAG: DUF3553 domain-containing protein [Kiloniellales bacterium]
MSDRFAPGDFVRLPEQPDWGLGQVQSVVGHRITVNFQHAGKRLINIDVVDLVPAADDDDQGPSPAKA